MTKRYSSKVVELADQYPQIAQKADTSNPLSLVDALFASLIHILVYPSKASQSKGINKNPITGSINRNDRYLFELGSYLIFMLDIWHVGRELTEYRDRVFYPILIQRFISLFQESLDVSDLHKVLNNRLDLYSRLYREFRGKPAHRIAFYFVELAKRSTADGSPEIHDFDNDFPVLLTNIQEEIAFRTEMTAYTVGMLPSLQNMFDYAYQHISFS